MKLSESLNIHAHAPTLEALWVQSDLLVLSNSCLIALSTEKLIFLVFRKLWIP